MKRPVPWSSCGFFFIRRTVDPVRLRKTEKAETWKSQSKKPRCRLLPVSKMQLKDEATWTETLQIAQAGRKLGSWEPVLPGPWTQVQVQAQAQARAQVHKVFPR